MAASWHVRVFRTLLLTYPASFRKQYGAEMEELFVTRLGRAHERSAPWAAVSLCLRTAIDLIGSAVMERAERDGVSAGAARLTTSDPDEKASAMNLLSQEIRHALKHFARTPVFSLGALLIVVLGIGANTAAFTFVNAFLLKPPAWNEPERVVNVYQDSDDGDPNSTSFPAYLDMASYTDVFSAVTASTPAGLTWQRDGVDGTAAIEFTTSSYLEVFGLRPSLGTWFPPEYDEVGVGTAVVVNHRTWTTKLGSDPNVVGSVVNIGGEPVTVLGVGPKGFAGNMMPVVTDFWLSISSVHLGGDFRVGNLERREDHWYDIKARLAPGVSAPAAQAAMDNLAKRLEREFPQVNTDRDITVFSYGDVRLHPDADGDLKPAAMALLGLVGLVLLLACSNLANLLLVRGISRMPEVALRRALGASRRQIARSFLVESLLLSVSGGLLGTLLAAWLTRFAPLLPLPLPMPGELDLRIDLRVLLFTFSLVLITGCMFGLAPAMRAASVDLVTALREGSRSASQGKRTALFRNGLVAVQVAASIVLVILCTLLVRNLAEVSSRGSGVDAEKVIYAEIDLGETGLGGPEQALLLQQIEEYASQLAGVESSSLATRLPANGQGGSSSTVIEGYEPPTGTGAIELNYSLIGSDYFRTMGQPLLEGRSFDSRDSTESPRVVIINETAARRYWGSKSALGGRMRGQSRPDSWVQVVGVVADSKVRSLAEPPTPIMFWPITQWQLGQATLVVRTAGSPQPLVNTIALEIASIQPGIEVGERGVLDDFIRSGLAGTRLIALVFGAFALLALMLASLGIYAVVSFGVAKRSAELGIRMALGAAREARSSQRS